MNMDLKDFIAGTLKEIIDGVGEADQYAKKKGGAIPSKFIANTSGVHGFVLATHAGPEFVNLIEFDVAISTTDSIENSREGKVSIQVIGASVQGKDVSQENYVNRVKFVIPLMIGKKTGDE
jgi:hypothetical protein